MAALTDMIYFRKISILRPKTNAGSGDAIGLIGYSGVEGTTAPADPEGMNALYSNVPASVQAVNAGRKKDGTLPEDIVFMPQWAIYIWGFSVVPQGAIRDRDFAQDDQGYRYQVAQAYYNILGWKLVTVRVQA